MYVTFEGLDGCGKTTVSKQMAEQFGAKWVCEPSDSRIGTFLRESFESHETAEFALLHLFLADRYEQKATVIDPLLEKGEIVFSDRGAESTRAYQLHEHGDWGRKYIDRCLAPALVPDLIVYLDIDVQTSLRRCAGGDIFEKREALEETQRRYWQNLGPKNNVVVIDATQPLEDVLTDTEGALKSALTIEDF